MKRTGAMLAATGVSLLASWAFGFTPAPPPPPPPDCLTPWGAVVDAALVSRDAVTFCTTHESPATKGSCWVVFMTTGPSAGLLKPVGKALTPRPARHTVRLEGATATICPKGGECRTFAPAGLPADADAGLEASVDEDGTRAVLTFRLAGDTTWIETYDLRSGARIARFKYRADTPCGYARALGETVLVASAPMCDPRPAGLFTAKGKRIGPIGPKGFSFDGTAAHAGGDIWAFGGVQGGKIAIVLQDTRTGRVVKRVDPRLGETYFFATELLSDPSGGFIVVYGNGLVLRYDATGAELARVALPMCSPPDGE